MDVKLNHEPPPQVAFTVIELLVLVATVAILGLMLLPALANAKPNTSASRCRNNLKQLTAAWKMYADDNNDRLVAARFILGRPIWMNGYLDFSPANTSNWDTNTDIVKSPLWTYAGKFAPLFKCPADSAYVTVNGAVKPRVRSYSMSHVFGTGEWLDGGPNRSQTVWRIYITGADVMVPATTFLFADEHPDSINDAALATQSSGNQPTDVPSQARLIDIPANYHNGACGFSFADGRSEIHKWVGSRMKNAPTDFTGTLPLNVPAGDSWVDAHWLAANTTVKRR